MKDVCADLLAEYSELAGYAERLTPEQWSTPTQFFRWTPWDEIAHLCFFDETALLAATDANAFADSANVLMAEVGKGIEMSAIARERYGHLNGNQLLAYWRAKFEELVIALSTFDSKARLPWYFLPMSARSFATARMMETWAHGQDVVDTLKAKRSPSSRLKHIAHIGVTTFGWTFVNRKLAVPSTQPHIELTAPGGEIWTWNEPSSDNFVRGSAEEFCLVVTQRRNIADVGLQYKGEPATQWLAIAQCFAGPPAAPPRPGERRVTYDEESKSVAGCNHA